MAQKIKAGAVSYLNTKPLIYGFEQGMMKDQVEFIIDYPSNIASLLINDQINLGLVPVAIIPLLKEYHIISDHCIGCDGEVSSVCLFSDVPLPEIQNILLDYQSRTSVELLKILLKHHWKISPALIAGEEGYENEIKAGTAGLVIGDRAFVERQKHKHVYDLGLAWKEMTGLPFVFATWISKTQMTESFETDFNKACEAGLNKLDAIAADNPFPGLDLRDYYTAFINFKLDDRKRAGLNLFLSMLGK